jgi:hypothetical protein
MTSRRPQDAHCERDENHNGEADDRRDRRGVPVKGRCRCRQRTRRKGWARLVRRLVVIPGKKSGQRDKAHCEQ